MAQQEIIRNPYNGELLVWNEWTEELETVLFEDLDWKKTTPVWI